MRRGVCGKLLLQVLPVTVPRLAVLSVTGVAAVSLAALSVPVTARWIRVFAHRLRTDEA